MIAIGGYFELELRNGETYHPTAIKLNTGRNALEYILRERKYDKIHLPYFTCDVILEPLKKLNISFKFYSINDQFEPILEVENIPENEGFILNNYFGLKDDLIYKYRNFSTLIVDNSQAFFSKPLKNVDTFYSPRKFFGIPDGGYLYINVNSQMQMKRDISSDRFEHLLLRTEKGAEAGYRSFQINDENLEEQPILAMSLITEKLLKSIDYNFVINRRCNNFKLLNQGLRKHNQFTHILKSDDVPMVYPFWSKNKSIREALSSQLIFTAVYWPNVKNWCEPQTLEYRLADEVVYLPVDQRYGADEMNKILKIINDEL